MIRIITKLMSEPIDSAHHFATLHMLVSEVCRKHGVMSNIVEIGVRDGFTTIPMLSAAFSRGCVLHSFDMYECRNRVENTAKRIKFDLLSMSSSWKYFTENSLEAYKRFEDKSVSLMFLDTSHVYIHTKDELNVWYPKMKKDGIICGHDYHEKEFPGVVKAVTEFQNNHCGKYELIVHPGTYNMFILWPLGE